MGEVWPGAERPDRAEQDRYGGVRTGQGFRTAGKERHDLALSGQDGAERQARIGEVGVDWRGPARTGRQGRARRGTARPGEAWRGR